MSSHEPAAPHPLLPVGKVVAYFVVLAVGVPIVDAMFVELFRNPNVIRLDKLSGLGTSILDANKNYDDLSITFFTLTIALLLIVPVAWVLQITRGDESEPSLPQTLIVLSIIVAGVTLLLQDSLARSFGLVGVVAAVRYRNTLKDSKDAVYIFLALGIGMACGLHAYPVAALLSAFECAILLVLWLIHRSRKPDEAHLLARLKASEKRGDRTPEQALAWLTPEARDRLEAELNVQSRFITMAAMLAHKHGRKPNAAITVRTTGAGSARDRINAEMAAHGGNWRLLGADEANGVTTLEYLGWVPRRKTPPLKFIERLQQADPDVSHVAFRSLRKMVPNKVELEPRPTPMVGPPVAAAPIHTSPHEGGKPT